MLPPKPVSSSIFAPIALTLMCAGVAGLLVTSGQDLSRSGSGTKPPDLVMASSDVPGMIVAIDWDFVRHPERLHRLALSGVEREKLRADLEAGRLRIGMIQVWDTVDEDGDQIRIEAVGFSQDLTILHRPSTFLIPYAPGGSVRITAIHDGAGGGVTLGVATVLGPTPLPPMVVSQSLEIPVL